MQKIKALAITGPTASGKTALSLECAKRLQGEIICLDSMQIYKGMDVGTAKATPSERAKAKHHMLDFLTPDIPYSAYAYKADAMRVAEDISLRGLLPIFVGGTGLYLDTLRRRGDTDIPAASAEYRERLLLTVKTEEDKIKLHKRLSEVDPESAEAIHYNNVKRVIRALEIFDTTGKSKSYFDKLGAMPDERISIVNVTLDFHSRETLYSRCDTRVDKMFDEGLADEAISLYQRGLFTENSTARGAIGYKEIIDAISEGLPPEAAKEKIKQATRNYAKRQLTWFRRDTEAVRLYADDENGIMKPIARLTEECIALAEAALNILK